MEQKFEKSNQVISHPVHNPPLQFTSFTRFWFLVCILLHNFQTIKLKDFRISIILVLFVAFGLVPLFPFMYDYLSLYFSHLIFHLNSSHFAPKRTQLVITTSTYVLSNRTSYFSDNSSQKIISISKYDTCWNLYKFAYLS